MSDKVPLFLSERWSTKSDQNQREKELQHRFHMQSPGQAIGGFISKDNDCLIVCSKRITNSSRQRLGIFSSVIGSNITVERNQVSLWSAFWEDSVRNLMERVSASLMKSDSEIGVFKQVLSFNVNGLCADVNPSLLSNKRDHPVESRTSHTIKTPQPKMTPRSYSRSIRKPRMTNRMKNTPLPTNRFEQSPFFGLNQRVKRFCYINIEHFQQQHNGRPLHHIGINPK